MVRVRVGSGIRYYLEKPTLVFREAQNARRGDGKDLSMRGDRGGHGGKALLIGAEPPFLPGAKFGLGGYCGLKMKRL